MNNLRAQWEITLKIGFKINNQKNLQLIGICNSDSYLNSDFKSERALKKTRVGIKIYTTSEQEKKYLFVK